MTEQAQATVEIPDSHSIGQSILHWMDGEWGPWVLIGLAVVGALTIFRKPIVQGVKFAKKAVKDYFCPPKA